ncbi:secretion protein EspK [Mycolicibacterium sp. S2-37]|uniref:secretion protein EspK n=1 Tax=Mycolicibacterium sp. S2-37 TaxID=2810297 RepID=UPI001A953981|nr:secretion protein EspK [Mycolicibacterium sp. S2-37]MBO0677349.1 secretion protein EspK [Mycolicibacterium sp. S2-37]
MGMVRPSGGHADRMLEPGGWPDTDEDVLYDRAGRFGDVLRDVTHVLDTSREQRTQVFDGGIWTGFAADGAAGALDAQIGRLTTLRDDVTGAIDWHDQVAGSVVIAKTYIGENVDTANQRIAVLEGDTTLTDEQRTAAIETVIATTLAANIGIVADVAAQIQATTASRPTWDIPSQPGAGNGAAPNTPSAPQTPAPAPGRTIPAPTPGVRPSPPVPIRPAPTDRPAHGTAPATPSEQPTAPSGGPPAPVAVTPIPVHPNPSGVSPVSPVRPNPVPPTPGKPPVSADPAVTEPAKPTTGRSRPGELPSVPAPPSVPGVPTAGIPQGLGPAASTPVGPDGVDRDIDEFDRDERDTADKGHAPDEITGPQEGPAGPGSSGDYGRGVTAASTVAAPAANVRAEDTGAAAGTASPMAPTGGAGGGMVPPAAGGSGGSGRGRSTAAPVSSRPLDPHPTSRARERLTGPAAAAAGRADQSDRRQDPEVPAVAVIPVSAARAERDAIADASAAEAQRRQARPDPLQVARRIAAALNAPDAGPDFALGFFWVTAVTADGDIVVANSYGLAYIPDGVELPEPVLLATADQSVPVADRTRWATYPVRAVSGWAAFHGKVIRAVIATEDQLGGADSGATQIVLAADDIPDSGAMSGRTRLVLVSAESAAKLAETADLELARLLPDSPDTATPEDRRSDLWFDVMKPMASRVGGREVAHLRAFRAYADHCRELALASALAATEPAPRRAAIADWRYWTHVTELVDGALAPTT